MATQAQAQASPFRTAAEKCLDRARKREAVLRAAVRMFNDRGFHATSLDEVASALGVTKPTVYHYFGSKENILLECVDRGIAELSDAAEVARRRSGVGLDRLRIFLLRYGEINMDDFGRCVIRTTDEQLSPEGRARFRAAKARIDRALRALILEGVADGSVVAADPKITAFALAGALNWPARWFDPAGPSSRAAVAAALVETLVAGLARRDAEAGPAQA